MIGSQSPWVRSLDKFRIGDGCWEWTGAKVYGGYGRIGGGRRGSGVFQAHRVVYETLVGPIPQGLVLDHLCRNRACVNPDHMEVVTHRVNILRGTGASARNVLVTHCPSGHEYTPENTRMHGTNRHCRTCAVVHTEKARLARQAAKGEIR